VNFTKPDHTVLHPEDPLPSGVDTSTISYVCEFLLTPPILFVSNSSTAVKSLDNGIGISFHLIPYSEPSPTDSLGWTTIEAILIRLNTSFAPSGRFPVYSNMSLPDANGTETRIGYDVVVCLHRYEVWIVETYNTSIVPPSVLRIVGKWDGSTPLSPSGSIQGNPISNTRYPNTTGKVYGFLLAHDNSAVTMWKDNDRTGRYLPSPTVGPIVPLCTFFLTLACGVGRIFHRRNWTQGVPGTLSRPGRHCPRTGWCGQCSTLPRGVGTRRCTILQ